jgi:hypothetical protein
MPRGAPVTVEAFAASYDRVARRTIEPGWVNRVGARIRSHALDRALIAGADPADSRQLAARAGTLTSRGHRLLMACGIERLLERAQEPPGPRRPVAPQRATVARHTEQLRALAALLRARTPLYARGIAMLTELLTDGTGPAYYGDPEAFSRWLRETRHALAG